MVEVRFRLRHRVGDADTGREAHNGGWDVKIMPRIGQLKSHSARIDPSVV